jgi:Tol biopolymer transport system component/DNA-binding winged helix-turn-helix (wHTH) protein
VATRYQWDDFVLDVEAYRLERAGAPLTLEPKAFNVLALLLERPGRVFSKQEIFDAVWPGTAVTDHALTRVIAQIRRVLGDEAREARYLETVPTRGYRWIHPLAPEGTPAASPVRPRRRIPVAWAAGAAALVVAATALLLRDGRAAAPASTAPPSRPVQVTTHGGLDYQPSLSPQGDAVAFTSDRSGSFEIYVRALGDSGTEMALTNDGGHNVEPAWSPDGQWMAFHSLQRGGVWVMPARGGVARQVAPAGSKPAWAPDSRRLAYQSDEHVDVSPYAFGASSGSTLWVVDVNGGVPQQVTKAGAPPGGHALPSWSPDGRMLVFTVFDGGFSDGVWTVDLETRTPAALAQGARYYDAAYTADGAAVLVSSGEGLLYRIALDGRTAGGTPVEVPLTGAQGVRGITVSAEGRRIAFAALTLNSQIWAQRLDPDGTPQGAAVPLTADTSRRNTVPVISPDGTKVAYMSARTGELPNVWVMDADGRNPVQLTSNESFDAQPVWFPDGRRVAFLSDREGAPGLWSVDITTRRQERVIDVARLRALAPAAWAQARVAELRLSPSLRQAAVTVLRGADANRMLFLTDLRSLAPQPLTDGREWIGYPAWSPDERRLAVEIKEGSSTQAAVLDLGTRELRRLTGERGNTWVRSWSPDGRRIAVAAFRDGAWNLRWIDVESGRQGTITPPEPARGYVRYPEWSPRGDVVVFERAEMRGNIWLLPVGD